MAIGMIVGGIGELFLDLFVQDEQQKRAAQAALWAATAGVGLFDPVMLAGASVKAVTKGVTAGIDDADAKGAIDTFGSVLSGGLDSNVQLLKSVAGAGVGAAIGGANGDAIQGMSLGASVMQGDAIRNAAQLGGGLVGGAAGAAAEEEGGFALGFQVGTAVGGAGADLGADAMAEDGLTGGAGQEPPVPRTGGRTQQAIASLAAEALAPVLAAAVHREEGGSFVEAWSAMRSVASSAAQAASAATGIDGSSLAEIGTAATGIAAPLASAGAALTSYLDRAALARRGELVTDEEREALRRRGLAAELAPAALRLANELLARPSRA